MNKPARLTLDEAAAAQTAAMDEFISICQRGRETAATIKELGSNRFKYLKACEALWDAHFFNIADTGVKVIR